MSLEGEVCSCAELQVFSCYRGWKEACQAKRAISTTSRRELSSSFFLLEGKAPKEIHAILIETLEEHAPSMAPSNARWPSLNVVIFPLVLRLVLDDPKQWPPRRLLINTFRCRRTESIVSLERGICSCDEFQVFFCYRGWKEACQVTRAISTTSRRELSSSFFLLQGKAPKKIHAILIETLGGTCTIVWHRQKLGGPV